MTGEGAEWTGQWVANKLVKEQTVESAATLSPQRIQVVRKELPAFVVATTAVARLDAATLEPLIAHPRPSFVVNVPRESYVAGSALKLAKKSKLAAGGLGDLVRALSLPDVTKYVNPEFAFVERGLEQHTKVTDYERMEDRLYTIKRTGMADIVAVFLNPYELTADHLRTARDRYGPFAEVVITNPNGSASASARRAAEDMGCTVYTWQEFFGRLNKK